MAAKDRELVALADIVGAGYVSQDTAPYTVMGVEPQWVVSPASEEEVSAILSLAHNLQVAVIPWGYGHQQHIGLPPRRGEIALSLRRLDRILEYEPADLTVTVQAGCTLGALQARLQSARQWLPYDPPQGAASSLGGLIATNISGPHRYRYGTLRDLVIRTRVVQGDGMAFTGGAKVVKNVSGYDLPRLMVGSFGTLGVITEATFKLQPMLKTSQTVLFSYHSFPAAVAQAAALLSTALVPVAVAVCNANAVQALSASLSHLDFPAALPSGDATLAGWLALRFGGVAGEVERQVRETRQLIQSPGYVGEITVPAAAQAAVWQAIADLPAPQGKVGPSRQVGLIAKIALPPQQLPEVSAQVQRMAGAAGLSLQAVAHPAAGILYLIGESPDQAGHTQGASLAPWINTLRQDITGREGTVVIEYYTDQLRQATDIWGPTSSSFPMMVALKNKFDPHRLLNPGRFVGDL